MYSFLVLTVVVDTDYNAILREGVCNIDTWYFAIAYTNIIYRWAQLIVDWSGLCDITLIRLYPLQLIWLILITNELRFGDSSNCFHWLIQLHDGLDVFVVVILDLLLNG